MLEVLLVIQGGYKDRGVTVAWVTGTDTLTDVLYSMSHRQRVDWTLTHRGTCNPPPISSRLLGQNVSSVADRTALTLYSTFDTIHFDQQFGADRSLVRFPPSSVSTQVRSKNVCWWSEYCLCCSTLKMCFIKTTVKLLVCSRSVTMQMCNNLKQVIISSECCIIQLLHETSQSWTYPNCHCTVFYWNV